MLSVFDASYPYIDRTAAVKTKYTSPRLCSLADKDRMASSPTNLPVRHSPSTGP